MASSNDFELHQVALTLSDGGLAKIKCGLGGGTGEMNSFSRS